MTQISSENSSSHPREAQIGDRSLFPDLLANAYLNHSAISPPSLPVRAAVKRALDDYAARGVAGILDWVEQRERTRELLAKLFNVQSADIGLVPNTTQGIINIALCFPWKRGDRVLLVRGEFPTNVTPWQRAAELFGLEICWIDAEELIAEDGRGLRRVEEELGKGLRLVALSLVEFQTGWRNPIREICDLCHAHGAEVFVDGIQACGVVPLDFQALGIDYLSCGGHKWMMAFEGAGFMYVHPDRIAALRPHVAGWLSHDEPLEFLFNGAGHLKYDRPIRARADFFEGGAQNVLGYAALEASSSLLLEMGVSKIFSHVTAYLDALEPQLVALGLESVRCSNPAARSGILSFRLPDQYSLQEVHQKLGERGVSCSTPDGYLRFAPHWPNSMSEIPLIVSSLKEALFSG